MTIAEFSAAAGDGISFQAGMTCTVVTKNANGWWYVDMDGDEGWVPSSYLEKVSGGNDDPVKSPSSPPVLPQPYKEKPKKKEQPKEVHRPSPVRKEPIKEPNREPVRKEPSKPRKESRNEPSSFEARKMSLASKSADSYEQQGSSLKRSTSTDSGLNEEIDGTKTKLCLTRSPPPVRVNHAPPRPSRPKASPTITNGPKSPRVSNRTTLKPTISSPMPLQSSPIMRRKSEKPATTPVPKTSNSATSRNIRELGVGFSRTSPATKRTPFQRGSSDDIRKRNSPTFPKKTSVPEVGVGALRDGHQWNGINDRRPSGSLRPPVRRDSNNATSGSDYRSELERKLIKKSGPQPVPSTTGPAQPPKRPSPPNRLKGPTKSSSIGIMKSKAPPSRPQPPKVGMVKRPPPPVVRPSTIPSKPKKTPSYVTIGNYTGGTDSCLCFDEGVEVEVIEKNDDGWWFVKIGDGEGWAPSTYIQEKSLGGGDGAGSGTGRHPPTKPKPLSAIATTPATASKQQETADEETEPSAPKPKPRPRPRKGTSTFYRAVDSCDVASDEDSGLPVVKGRVYELKEKSDGGWWLMKDGNIEGWAPSTYFKLV